MWEGGGAIEVVGISQEKPYEHEKDSGLSLSVRAGDMLGGGCHAQR